MNAVEQYPALPDLKPLGTYRVVVCFWLDHSKAWGRWVGVGNYTTLEQAQAARAEDARAVRQTYGGLIDTTRGPRVYRIFKCDGWEAVGGDDVR